MTETPAEKPTGSFDDLIDDVAQEMENQALTKLMESGLKAAHICAAVFKEAKDGGLPKDLAENMAADVWKIIMLPFVVSGDDPGEVPHVCVTE